MPQYFGVDSCTEVDGALYQFAVDATSSKTKPAFWGRYFNAASATPDCAYTNKGPTGYPEAQVLGNRGTDYLLPIGRVGNTQASASQATTDASDICAAIVAAIDGSEYSGTYTLSWPGAVPGSPPLPGSDGSVYVYLDIETDAGLTQEYWDAFASAMYSYGVKSIIGRNPVLLYPFRACAYVNPCDATSPYCSILAKYSTGGADPQYACWALWTSENEPGGSICTNAFPAWSSTGCNSTGPVSCTNLRTFLWQYAEPSGCSNLSGTPGSVDLDAAHAMYDALLFMLVCSG